MSAFINVSPLPAPKTIRFVNSTNQPTTKRRRIRAACLTCRKRKTRCGGEQPICKTCRQFNHTCLGYLDKRDAEDDNKDDNKDGNKEDVDEDADADDDERRHSKANEAKRLSADTARDGGQIAKPETSWDGTTLDQIPTRQQPNQPNWQANWQANWQGEAALHAIQISGPGDLSPISMRSPLPHHSDRHRVPYFRYFGPTAIVPGFKQMVVSVRDRKRCSVNSHSVATSPGAGSAYGEAASDNDAAGMDDMPVYDPNDAAPVHPLILSLTRTFFIHLGCNYPFLREAEFTRMIQEKRVEPILVDAVCALSARFSSEPIFSRGGKSANSNSNAATGDGLGRPSCADNGAVFAQRAKAATVDTFLCPSVEAIQACLLMAYEGFGADQDSALWMYLGCAIRMAVDLGLQKNVGVQYQGAADPWYARNWSHAAAGEQAFNAKSEGGHASPRISFEEQKLLEQGKRDTFWAVFVLDRVISSGTGRPVTFRDGDFELALPETTVDPATGLADPLPMFIQTIHLYGRASDVFNNIRSASDLTHDKLHTLRLIESDLTALHHRQHPSLNFNPTNFTAYYQAGRGTTFVLMHVWFHALIIILHQPTLVTSFVGSDDQQPGSVKQPQSQPPQLSPNSLELAMSSARTIADILAFSYNTYIFETPSFLGNPFTSQPMYIAACACLRYKATHQELEVAESREGGVGDAGHAVHDFNTSAHAHPAYPQSSSLGLMVHPPEPLGSPPVLRNGSQDANANHCSPSSGSTPPKHSILAATYEKNYLWCYNSLKRLHTHWGGVKYILTALDQKAKGIWDCETFTREEYEAAKMNLRHGSKDPPIAMTVAGTLDSPSSSLTVIHQDSYARLSPQSMASAPAVSPALHLLHPGAHHMGFPPPPPPPIPSPVTTTPPGNMIYDPIRHALPEPPSPPTMFPPMYPGTYPQPNTSAIRHSPNLQRQSLVSAINIPTTPVSSMPVASKALYSIAEHMDNHGVTSIQGILHAQQQQQSQQPPPSQQQNIFTPTSQHSTTVYESIMNGTSPSSNGTATPGNYAYTTVGGGHSVGGVAINNGTGPDPGAEKLTFDSRDIDINQLHNEMVMIPGWEAYYSDELLGFFGSGGI